MAHKIGLSTTPPGISTETIQVGATDTETVVTETSQVQQPESQTKIEEPLRADEFFETLNKKFNTTFKTEDEIKNVFGLPKRITEYETKLKESEELEKSIEDYRKRIEELEELQDPLKYFSSPDAFIAEQLKIKYPKSNPVLLHQIATTDMSKMDDLDILIKDRQLFIPDAPKEEVMRKIILKKYGIDSTLSPEEWDEISVGEMKLDAAAAREKIIGLKGVIEMPKIPNKEQKQKEEADALAKRETTLIPLKETFSKYDLFSHKEIEGFGMDVPGEYKDKLPDMFQSMFIEAGLEPNEENLQTALELRDALFVHQYLPKLREIWIKEGETKAEAKKDEELHNTQPPNTATMTDQGIVDPLAGRGLGKFLQDQKRR